ncbi:hypothetical protein, partial [Dyadobacter sp. CY343]|uniref:hypothetical protein n=1 Tax=Dyadobacter sp. CY343 TaxID=2907299 RepID=UPI001F3433B6
ESFRTSGLAVCATVVPDWECKSAGFIFNIQIQKQNIFTKILTLQRNSLKMKIEEWKKNLK